MMSSSRKSFSNRQKPRISDPETVPDQTQRAEEVHGTREIFQQKANGEDVEENPKGAAQAIMRRAAGSGSVLNGHFTDPSAVETRQGRNEAVQFAVKVDVFEDLRPVRLEGGAEIAQIDAGGLRHEPVGDARRNLAGYGIIHPLFAPTAGDVESLIDFLQEGGNIFRSVLQIAVHGDDHLAAGLVKAGRESGRLSEVAPQADHLQVRIGFDQIAQQLVAAIGRSVVDIENFVGPAQPDQYGG